MFGLLLTTNRDPRTDTRVAEAVRVAAGIGAWKKMRVDLLLRDSAVFALDQFPEDLADGMLIREYLPAIQQHGGEIFVCSGNSLLQSLKTQTKFRTVNQSAINKLIHSARYSLQW
jgi:hypothetical protein